MLGAPPQNNSHDLTSIKRARAEQAFNLDLSIMMRFRSGRAVPVRLKRLSAAAVVIESPEPVVPGTEVEIFLPAVGVRTVEVDWQVAGRVGGCLEKLLKPSELFVARMAAFDRAHS
jgi:hypothetical protein